MPLVPSKFGDTLVLNTMIETNFMAYTAHDASGGGGWARSDNEAIANGTDMPAPPNTFTVTARPGQSAAFADEYAGFRAYIVNTTRDTMTFNAVDSRLCMLMQARDTDGTWRNIQYMPSSFCGNSYHRILLAPGEHWRFTVPCFHGAFRTRLRLALTGFRTGVPPGIHSDEIGWGASDQKANAEAKERIIYSNEFEGSINRGQFQKRARHRSGGLMDPIR